MSELLDTIQDGVYRLLRKHGVEDGLAGDDAAEFCARIRRDFGGFEAYVPRPDKRARNRAIKDDLARSGDRRAVAQKHGVSISTVSRIARDDEQEGFGSADWNL